MYTWSNWFYVISSRYGTSLYSCSRSSRVSDWEGVRGAWVSGMDVTMVWSTMLVSMEGHVFSYLPSRSLLVSIFVVPCVWLSNGDEFSQCPRRRGRQFKHSLPAFLQEQCLHRPLALHRQYKTGMPQHTM